MIQFLERLSKEVQLRSQSPRIANFGVQTSSSKSPPGNPSGNAPAKVTIPSNDPCPHCGQSHPLHRCDAFKALCIKDRLTFFQSKKLCMNCFKPEHLGRDCTRQFVCTVPGCGMKHSKYLHLPRPRSDTNSTPTENQPATDGSSLLPTTTTPSPVVSIM